MLSFFEELVLYITIPLVALFAHRQYTYEFSTPKYAILTVATLLIGLYLLWRMFKTKQIKFFASKIHFVWFAFSIVALLSTINTWKDNPYFFRQGIDIGLYLFLNVILAFYFATILNDKQKIVRFLFIFVLTGLFIAVNAILNFYMGYDIFLGQVGNPFERASIKANIGNVIFVSNYLNMLLPIALYFVISLDIGAINLKKFVGIAFVKIMSLISALLYITVIIFSQTRSEYLALIVEGILLAVAYIFYIRKRENLHEKELEKKNPSLLKKLKFLRRISVAVFVLITILLIVLYNVPSAFNNYGSFKMTDRFSAMASVSSMDERFLSWFSTIYIWQKHKILGQGIGTYQIYSLYGIADLIENNPEYNYGWNNFKRAHNDYFQVLSETGLIGFGLILVMLILLVIYVVKNTQKIDEQDDITLFSMLVLSGVVFAFQSVFSFPGHLLPNALLATFVLSVGLGKYFNKVDGKEYKLHGVKAVALGLVLVGTIGASTYLRWNHFISEVYFRNGNVAFQTMTMLRDQQTQIENYLKQLDQIESDLNSFSGQFVGLSEENWHGQKQAEARRLGIAYDRLKAENERQQTIQNIRSQINANRNQLLAQKQGIPNEIMKQYQEAKENLLKSVKLNHTYGKSFFYLAALAADPIRIEELKQRLKQDPQSVLNQEADEYHKLLPERFKTRYFAVLNDYLKANPDFVDKFDLATTQALVDSAGIYELSLLTFTERNTFKTLAVRYNSLYRVTEMLLDNIKDADLEQKIGGLLSIFFNKFDTWTRRTLYIMPGGWNRFPDWKNIDIELATSGGQDVYRFFANMTVTLKDPINYDARRLLVDMANLEIKTCKYMESKGVWGVPDGVLDHLHALAREYQLISDYQESVYTYKQLLDMYKETYEYISKKLSDEDSWKSTFEQLVEQSKQSLDKILEDDEKGSLSNSLTPIFVDKINRLHEQLIQTDFKAVEKDFVDQLSRLPASIWPQVSKKSVWKTNAYNSMLDFENQTRVLGFSDNAKSQITSLMTSIITSRSMMLYERYARFKAHYELIKDELLSTVVMLLDKYKSEEESEILKDWGEVSFNIPKYASKGEVIEFLNQLLNEYSK
ncbi:O-antigen ligase family protein [Fervidobacterium gondwanense]|uniref:O-antigen ligase family protein n=1 Tax=Fervidobacterium gondwanense TaxID=44754 RepID=UPI003C777A3D